MEFQNFILVLFIDFIINIPFGYWRQGVKKFSVAWFFAIHIPVPAIVFLRFYFELGFIWWTYPFMLFIFVAGQWTGARIRKKLLLLNKVK